MDYDVIIVGCGSGGYEAALLCSQLEGKTAIVEAEEFGGTCVNKGCIPSKVWHKATKIWTDINEGEAFGISVSEKKIDLKTVIDRKKGISSDIRKGMEATLEGSGVDIIKGKAIFKKPLEVDVDGIVYTAGKIIFATGSTLSFPDVAGVKEAAITTDDVLEMEKLPDSVLIYGAGYIEVEEAGLLSALGTRVTLAFQGARILEKEDHETSQRISQVLKEQGVNIVARATLASVEKKDDDFIFSFSGAKDIIIEATRILVCSRKPRVEAMGLCDAGIDLNDEGGIKVNDHLETSVKNVYAIGDVTGGWMLSHAASAMGLVAAKNAMGEHHKFPFNLVPRGIWTIPELGAVGLSEEEAEKEGYEVEVASFPYSMNGLAMCRNEQEGAVKIVADATHGEILGVHIIGSQATELIGEAVLAMQLEATVQEFAKSMRVHPTFSEAVVLASRGMDI
ncbi:dihydrolipoamide dehydrogenase [Desulfocicer vacuolatum DSM 3385]|uniref:Dihydrolipoyl dehydrogenase n=1 Tax=Desulfocicer vacuolatum DSM 3385 TaxID=1121400 RepID=A0A1W2D6V1_9BACT|nr:NAD(P)/FAD-dependent oxidoreductase [Desulfocicer vacuolatum]SMC92792.1 dihydrolipoamide dehydrogenase [Desulfocicer vacuolatum DSM 3385]